MSRNGSRVRLSEITDHHARHLIADANNESTLKNHSQGNHYLCLIDLSRPSNIIPKANHYGASVIKIRNVRKIRVFELTTNIFGKK